MSFKNTKFLQALCYIQQIFQADDDDVPPLEDCSDLISKINVISHESNKNQKEIKLCASPVNEDPKIKSSTENSPKCFAGMQKGFLFSKPKSENKIKPDIPYIAPKQDKDAHLRFDEVQENIKEDKEWITNDLLSKISDDQELKKWLTDPRSASILKEFQENPTAAKEKYKNNPDVISTFLNFSKLLGEHFNQLGDVNPPLISESSSQIQPHVDDDVSTALSKDGVQEAMSDKRILEIIRQLKENPSRAMSLVQQSDHDVQLKLKTLIDAGILGLAS